MTVRYGKNLHKFDFPDLCASTDVRPHYFKAKMYAISSDTHQLQFLKLHHFKLERI